MAEFIDTKDTIYTNRIKNDFENLKNEVLTNSEILKEFSPDDIVEFYKKINIFSRKCIDADEYNKEFTLLSYINGREDFYQKLTTTTCISYLFRQCLEYSINIEDLKKKVADSDFLEPLPNKYCVNVDHEYQLLLKKNKQKLVKELYDVDYDINDYEQAVELSNIEITYYENDKLEKETNLELQNLQETKYEVNKEKKMNKIKDLINEQSDAERKVIYKFLKNTFGFNPDRHIKQSYKYEDIVDQYSDYKKLVLDKLENDVKKELNIDSSFIEETVPSDNLWYNFKNYYESHYEIFKTFTNLLYKVDSDRDLMINIHGQFDNKEDVSKFVKLNTPNFITNPVLINNNCWKLLSKYLPNRVNGEVIGQDSDIVNGLLDKYKEDSKIASELTKQNLKRSKLETMYKTNKTQENLKEYLNMKGISQNEDNTVTDQEYDAFENKIKNITKEDNDEECKEDYVNPDDYTIKYKIIKASDDSIGETTIYT